MLERHMLRLSSAYSRPKVVVDLGEDVVSFSDKFHSKSENHAVLLSLYKKSASSATASSIIPSGGDLVLLAKKRPDARFMAGKFALLGGIIEKRDLLTADDLLGVLETALAREVFEETGLAKPAFAHSYCASFYDKATNFHVHCFSGFLLSDPSKSSQAQHLSHANLKPADGEHENFSWMPVNRAFSSRQVADVAKRAIDLTVERW